MRANARSAGTVQWMIRTSAWLSNGVRPGRQIRSWKAASATTVVPRPTSSPTTSKNVDSVRIVNGSPGPGTNPGVACAIPSLISSRQIAGHPIAAATRCASVVFPVPGGPLTTTTIGFDCTAAP